MDDHKYAEISRLLRQSIEQGVYQPNQKLPSENQLAAKTGFSRQTIRQGMLLLEREGLIERVQGSGTFVRSIVSRRPRNYNIAVVTTYISQYIFPSILQGISETLSAKGYTPLLSATQNRVDIERRVLTDLMQKPIDGMLVEGTKTAHPNPNIDLYEAIARQGIPVVFINGFYSGLKSPIYVVANDRKGGRMACQYLIDQGHTRIAGFFKSDDVQGHRRYAGYTEALLQAGLMVEDDRVLWYTTEDRDLLLEHRAKQIMAGCTAAVCYNDEAAMRIIRACGVDSAKWVSFDHSAYAKMPGAPLVSLGHPKAALGRLAAEKLINLMNGRIETPAVLDFTAPE